MSAPFLHPLPGASMAQAHPARWWPFGAFRKRETPDAPMCRLTGCFAPATTTAKVMGRDEDVCAFHASMLKASGRAS